MLRPKDKIGAYTLVTKLGEGTFGEVWKAEKRSALAISEFALKFIRSQDDKPVDLEAVKKELLVGQKVSGLPHIIQLIEADIYDNYVYIVSEYADGGSLEKWLRVNNGKARSYEQAVAIAVEILKGLEGLHRQGFIHRDLKPANILIKKETYCLADFGIARQMQTNSATMTTKGTCYYMPPEAFVKMPLVSIHTDIWAVGVILQQLLIGEMPFPQDDVHSLMWAIKHEAPEPLSESVPSDIRAIVNKALQKDRENRFQSARAMRVALEKAWENQAIRSATANLPEDEWLSETVEIIDGERYGTTIRTYTEPTVQDSIETLPALSPTIASTPATASAAAETRQVTNNIPATFITTSSRKNIFIGLSVFIIIVAASAFGIYNFSMVKSVTPANSENSSYPQSNTLPITEPTAKSSIQTVTSEPEQQAPIESPLSNTTLTPINPKAKPKEAVPLKTTSPPAGRRTSKPVTKPQDPRCVIDKTC